MVDRSAFFGVGLVSILSLAAAQAACGGSGNGATTQGSGGSHASSSSTGGAGIGGNTFLTTSSAGGAQQDFEVLPSALQTLTVVAGQTPPTVAYTATLDGSPVNAGWGLDKGNLGTIAAGPSSSATFVPSGAAGGLVTVLAGLNSMTVKRQIMIKLTGQQNGADPSKPSEQAQLPTDPAQLKAGGGVNGVGGEGLGGPVTDMATLMALASPVGDGKAQGLTMLYPYDKTVWPRGMLAPLLMWSWSTGDADAIQIQITSTSGSYAWKGTFARPTIVTQLGTKFIRHPIPQDVWDTATNSAGGADQLTVSLIVASAKQAYGPITQTWTVAPARLSGTVYYNSYGTQLVKNWGALDAAGHSVGAAILGVRSGDTGPTLIVGQNSPTNAQGNPADDSGCRVCHTVASRGRWLLTQSEQGSPGDGRSFLYDLTAADVQGSVAQIPQEGVFGWAAMNGDGSYALTNTIDPSSSNPAISGSTNGSSTSSFWQFGAAPQAATLTGLPGGVAAGYPTYSPDDTHVAYIDVTGSTQDVHGPLVTGSYDAATQAFSGLATVHTPAAGQRIGYPTFLPDNSGILFETQVRKSQGDTVMVTRNGARSELWWVNLTGGTPTPTPLATLNGKGASGPYIPSGPNNHGAASAFDPQSAYDETGRDDTTLNYEPTVLPVVEGGYAWVVFTSRRLYGNQLGAVPWLSWPPSYDTTDLAQATVKKLWVTAIDLNAPPGTDPSHPAFYLPAQEILAGNSRGFWVLDPCEPDGQTCATGDQCCNGYCEPGSGGGLVCTNAPPGGHCSAPQEKCITAADCCDPTNVCINGFCATKGVN